MQSFKTFQKNAGALLPLLLAVMALGMMGCEGDSPTAPTRQAPPSTPPPASSTWSITASANPSSFKVTAEGESQEFITTLSVLVVDANTNQPPPDGSLVQISTLEASGVLTLKNGTAAANFAFTAFTSGTLNITFTFQGNQAIVPLTITVGDPPPESVPIFIEDVKPDRGAPTGGERVIINGQGFEEPLRVFFGSELAEVRSVSDTRIVARTPSIELAVGQTSTVTVRVDSAIATSTARSYSLTEAYTYTRVPGGDGTPLPLTPKIVSFTPPGGVNDGETEVTINGEGFESDVQVFFGVAEASLRSVSSTRIVALSPPATGFNSSNRNSNVTIRVLNVASGTSTTSRQQFRYGDGGGAMGITAIGPTQGRFTGGTLVTLYGFGFEGPGTVGIEDIAQRVISITGTEVVFRTSGIVPDGCGDVTGAVSYTMIEEPGTSVSGGSFTYLVPEPFVSSVSPATIVYNTAGNIVATQFTITGGNFSPDVGVVFSSEGGTEVPIGDAVSNALSLEEFGDTITGTIPNLNRLLDELPTEDCDVNGDGVSGTRLIPAWADITVTNVDANCPAETFTRAIYYTPSSTLCDEPPPVPVPLPDLVADIEPGGDGGTIELTITDPAALATVAFLDASTGGPTSWAWSFPGGSILSSTLRDPGPVSFACTGCAAPGDSQTYIVSLRVNRASDGATDTATVTVVVTVAGALPP